MSLSPVWEGRTRLWVTIDAPDAHALLADEAVIYASGPTTRSVRKLLWNLITAWRLFLRVRPRVLLSTGAGLAVPFAWIAWLFGCRVVFIECCGRVDQPSLTFRLIAPIAERLYVQWPDLLRHHRRATYVGQIPLFGMARDSYRESHPSRPLNVFVTVGSSGQFQFDRLIAAAGSLAGTGRVLIQYGCSKRPATRATCVDYLSYEDMVTALRQADVIVTHSGIGSVLLALGCGRRPIIVPRDPERGEAVDAHQIEFARRLDGLGLARCVEDTAQLAAVIDESQGTPRRRNRHDESNELVQALNAVIHSHDRPADGLERKPPPVPETQRFD